LSLETAKLHPSSLVAYRRDSGSKGNEFQQQVVEKSYWVDSSPSTAKTKSHSLNLFSLLCSQTPKNEIDIGLKNGITLLFQSIIRIITILLSNIMTGVSTLAEVTTST
jgi:hypothetical protein